MYQLEYHGPGELVYVKDTAESYTYLKVHAAKTAQANGLVAPDFLKQYNEDVWAAYYPTFSWVIRKVDETTRENAEPLVKNGLDQMLPSQLYRRCKELTGENAALEKDLNQCKAAHARDVGSCTEETMDYLVKYLVAADDRDDIAGELYDICKSNLSLTNRLQNVTDNKNYYYGHTIRLQEECDDLRKKLDAEMAARADAFEIVAELKQTRHELCKKIDNYLLRQN